MGSFAVLHPALRPGLDEQIHGGFGGVVKTEKKKISTQYLNNRQDLLTDAPSVRLLSLSFFLGLTPFHRDRDGLGLRLEALCRV